MSTRSFQQIVDDHAMKNHALSVQHEAHHRAQSALQKLFELGYSWDTGRRAWVRPETREQRGQRMVDTWPPIRPEMLEVEEDRFSDRFPNQARPLHL